ncbi:hypothetical protein BDK51DRAFT_50234 [Blyttiomyces helicus]|uniref:poly(ADP-ribose) glycohydrolase n=1 Tax=Blyttiomyces helicus TaxID=388810 RepID=A0A4P9WG46_9FUNG|nr:hypothetical protein BDK51DRAFT_50234 [Blyttiomyces helicus]|eukprot:RKO90865.1 hypothetical protein BDK51DRAFT_50234 [Blyttiomyces helicus]
MRPPKKWRQTTLTFAPARHDPHSNSRPASPPILPQPPPPPPPPLLPFPGGPYPQRPVDAAQSPLTSVGTPPSSSTRKRKVDSDKDLPAGRSPPTTTSATPADDAAPQKAVSYLGRWISSRTTTATSKSSSSASQPTHATSTPDDIDSDVTTDEQKVEDEIVDGGAKKQEEDEVMFCATLEAAAAVEAANIAEIEAAELQRRAKRLVYSSIVLCSIPPESTALDPTDYRDEWNTQNVRLPCSAKNVERFQSPSGSAPSYASKWDTIEEVLQAKMEKPEDFKEVILAYNEAQRSRWKTTGIEFFLKRVVDNPAHYLEKVIPLISRMALRLPILFPQPVPLLRRGCNMAVTLSQMQIASLLANAFFCTFPRRNDLRRSAEYGSFPSIHFDSLFAGSGSPPRCSGPQIAKLEGLFSYFERVGRKPPTGCVTFHRQVLARGDIRSWHQLEFTLGGLDVRPKGTIEDDGGGMSQLDFANKRIGAVSLTAGILPRVPSHPLISTFAPPHPPPPPPFQGAVQEEIRFIINPELIVSRLFVEELGDEEALIMVGAERFSDYEGYGDTFKWKGPHEDLAPRDALCRLKTEIIAVDALHFGAFPEDQYKRSAIVRELNKAYCGFLPSPASCYDAAAPLATGCGAFRGDPELKSLIQLMAASAVGRRTVYFTFYDENFAERLEFLHRCLVEAKITVAQLFKWLVSYRSEYLLRPPSERPPVGGLFEFVMFQVNPSAL